MKKDNFLRCIAIFCIVILALLSAPELKAQGDILDLCTQSVSDCDNDPLLSITVNIDGDGVDTIVIIENFSGFRAIDKDVTDKNYQFAAGVGGPCSASTAGKFCIHFESPSGTKIGVNRINFYIERNSSINYTVTSWQGETGTDYPKTESFPFVFEDCSTEFDSIIISADNANLTVETLFILDNLFINKLSANITPDPATVCAGEDLVLNGNPFGGSGTYPTHLWEGAGASSLSATDTQNPTFNNTTPGSYALTYTVTDNIGCTGTDTITVNVNATPDITNPGNQIVCDSYTLPTITGTNLSGSEAYYTGTGGTGTSYAAGAVISSSISTLYIYDANGSCSDQESFSITINTTPDITNPGNQIVCESYTLPTITGTNLSGSEAYYTGTGGTGTSYAAGAVISSSISTLYIYDANGSCSDQESFSITVNPLPDVNTGSYGPLCIDAASIIITGTPPNGTWNGLGITDNGNGTGNFDPANAGPGEHQLTYSYTDNNGCSNNDITFITVNEIPKIVCVMDLSYSMNRDFEDHTTSDPNKQKLPMAKNALEGFVDLLYNHVGDGFCPNLGLSRFPDSPQVGCDANSIKTIQILNNILYSELTNDPTGVIPNLIADGNSTPLLEGINTAINMFNPTDNLKMIVLLSDGRHNCPSSNIDDSDIETISTKLNDQGIKLYTIGFGLNTLVPNDLLNQLATKHYNITSITDKPPEDPEDEPVDPSYIPGSSTAWDAATALAATYANILQEGLPDIALSLDPLDIINHSKVKQIVVPVSRFDRKVCFYISWVTPQVNQLLVKLFTPDGTELPLNHAGIIVTRRKSHTIISISNEILSQEGMIGNWKLEIDGSGIKTSAERYQYTVFTSSKKLLLNTWFDKNTYYTGDEMKIYLELLVDNRPLTPLDNIFVKASGPGQGLGSWLVSKNVTREQLEKMKQSQFEAFIKYEKEKPEFNELNRAQKQKAEEALRKKFMGNIDPIHLRAQVLLKEFNMKYPHRLLFEDLEFNDKGKDGDEKPGDGLYTAVYKPLTKEGNYQFFFTVIDTSKEKNIKRESQLQKFVNVKIKPERFIKDIMRIDTVLKGVMVYNITLNLRDKYGNIPSPDALRKIKLSVDKGELIDNIQANPDGTFTQMVSLPENVKPRQVKMTMNVYDQVGEQRLESRIPRLIYIIIISVILIITGVYKRNKNRQRII